MLRLKNKLVVAAISALMAELLLPGVVPVAQAAGTPQFNIASVRLDRTIASNSAGAPATVTYTGGTVCVATPATLTGPEGTETDVEIGFPAEQGGSINPATNDFEVNTTLGNWATNTTDPGSANTGQNYFPLLDGETSVTAWPGLGATAEAANNTAYASGDVASKKIVRFAMSSAMLASKDYCFNWTSGQTAGTSSLQLPDIGTNGYQENVPGFITTYHCSGACTAIGAGTPTFSSNWGVQITSASTAVCAITPCNDYYVVNAVVPPLLIFSLDHNTDTFVTNLDPNQAVLTNGVTATVQTNAKGGWVMWAKDTDRSGNASPLNNQGLQSASSGGHIDTVPWNADAPTLVWTTGTPPATATYGLIARATSNVNGAGTTGCGASNPTPGAIVEPEYDGSLVSPVTVGAFEKDWSEVADCSASTNGTDGGSTVNLKEAATVTFNTPAATDYTDTVYVAAAGEF